MVSCAAPNRNCFESPLTSRNFPHFFSFLVAELSFAPSFPSVRSCYFRCCAPSGWCALFVPRSRSFIHCNFAKLILQCALHLSLFHLLASIVPQLDQDARAQEPSKERPRGTLAAHEVFGRVRYFLAMQFRSIVSMLTQPRRWTARFTCTAGLPDIIEIDTRLGESIAAGKSQTRKICN